MAGLRLREAAPQDLAEVAALHRRLHPESVWPSDSARAAYFHEILFGNPWRDSRLPSWVAQENGRIVGFLGVIARRMVFGTRPLQVAVGCQFMVAPEKRRSFAALELMRRLFAGPQDLTIADGANEASRALWEACGGIASPMHSLHWVRLLRPARGLLQLAAERPGIGALGVLGTPLAVLADACIAALPRDRPPSTLAAEPAEARNLVEALEHHRAAFALRPLYDPAGLAWLLEQARSKRRYGTLQGAVLREPNGRIAGWFLYYFNRRASQVLQLGASRERAGAVLDALFEHARRRGAVAIGGRLEPHFSPALAGKRCLIQNRGILTLLHARDPALLVPFLRGDALFTRLEGEWWTRFAGGAQTSVSSERMMGGARLQEAR